MRQWVGAGLARRAWDPQIDATRSCPRKHREPSIPVVCDAVTVLTAFPKAIAKKRLKV